MRMRSLMTQAPSRNPSLVLKRPLDQHHLGCINLGQSVLVPYQPSASSYATGSRLLVGREMAYNFRLYMTVPLWLLHHLRLVHMKVSAENGGFLSIESTLLLCCGTGSSLKKTTVQMPTLLSHCKKAFVILTIAFVTRIATVDQNSPLW